MGKMQRVTASGIFMIFTFNENLCKFPLLCNASSSSSSSPLFSPCTPPHAANEMHFTFVRVCFMFIYCFIYILFNETTEKQQNRAHKYVPENIYLVIIFNILLIWFSFCIPGLSLMCLMVDLYFSSICWCEQLLASRIEPQFRKVLNLLSPFA